MKILLADKADIAAKAKDDGTPLHWAASHGQADVARLLLDHHADIEARNNNGQTPLHVAVWKGHTEVVKTLLAHKADIAAKDMKGNRRWTLPKPRDTKTWRTCFAKLQPLSSRFALLKGGD